MWFVIFCVVVGIFFNLIFFLGDGLDWLVKVVRFGNVKFNVVGLEFMDDLLFEVGVELFVFSKELVFFIVWLFIVILCCL